MAIIISSNGKKAVKVDRSSFEKEDALQQYIYENPESIPLYDIKEDIRLLILAREFPTTSGPIDAIGIDAYGELYIVETKLYKNADKRTVIAQALDYGAALWKHSNDFNEFLGILDGHTQKVFGLRTTEKIKEFFQLGDEEVAAIIEKARANLNDGAFHFVILMDKLEDRLKDLVLFVNQNSQFDVYVVELEYYKHDSYEIIIPKIFGAEVKKDISVSSTSSVRQKWTEAMLMDDAQKNYSAHEFAAFKKVYEFSKKTADEVRLGTGSYASFSPIYERICDKSLFTLSTDGRLSFNFHWIHNDGFVKKYKEALSDAGFTIPDNPRVDTFISLLSDITKTGE
jgi:hypothetical protein